MHALFALHRAQADCDTAGCCCRHPCRVRNIEMAPSHAWILLQPPSRPSVGGHAWHWQPDTNHEAVQVKSPTQTVGIEPPCATGWYTESTPREFISCKTYHTAFQCVQAAIPESHVLPAEVCPDSSDWCEQTEGGPGAHRWPRVHHNSNG